MSKVTIHYLKRPERAWKEATLEVIKRDDERLNGDYFYVLYEGDHIGVFQRIDNHRTHQVHGRIRYDNKPRTRFQRVRETFDGPRHFVEDTRVEVLGDILADHLDIEVFRTECHLAGRKPRWLGCDLHG